MPTLFNSHVSFRHLHLLRPPSSPPGYRIPLFHPLFTIATTFFPPFFPVLIPFPLQNPMTTLFLPLQPSSKPPQNASARVMTSLKISPQASLALKPPHPLPFHILFHYFSLLILTLLQDVLPLPLPLLYLPQLLVQLHLVQLLASFTVSPLRFTPLLT